MLAFMTSMAMPFLLPIYAGWMAALLLFSLVMFARSESQRKHSRGASRSAMFVLLVRFAIDRLGIREDASSVALMQQHPFGKRFGLAQRLSEWFAVVKDKKKSVRERVVMFSTKKLFDTHLVQERLGFFDRSIARFKHEQLIIVGAGFDARAYGENEENVQERTGYADYVFEIDKLETQAWKRDMLRRAGLREPNNIKYIKCDFNGNESWIVLAKRAGFDPFKSFTILWEGVSYYLPPDTVNKFLRETSELLRQNPGRGVLLFDFMDEKIFRKAFDWRSFGIRAAVWAMGEPMLSGLPLDDFQNHMQREYQLQTIQNLKLAFTGVAAVSALPSSTSPS